MRKRRVRLFEIFLVFLLAFTLVGAALYWSDFSVGPGVSAQYVQYTSSDGVVISGALFEPSHAAGPLPGVVVVHGLTSYKESMNRLSVELARRGFVVLAIDLRDHGMSNGTCTFGLPTAEPQDVANGVQFLRSQAGVDANHLAIVGHSFGGLATLTASSMSSTQVNATVTWAAPVNLTSLNRDNHETVAFIADKRVLPPDILDAPQLAIRSPINYISNLRPNSTLFLHAVDDTIIPLSQADEAANATASQGQRLEAVESAGHAMDTLEVLDKTIAFLEVKLKGKVSQPLDPAYPSFQRDAAAITLFITLLNLPLAWLSWEFWCTRSPQKVRLYNYPADRTRLKALAFVAADVAAFGAIVYAAGLLVAPGAAPVAFQGVLPAPTLFSALLAAGAGLCAAAFGLARGERAVRGRDDTRFEEGENLRRSAAVMTPVLIVIALTVGLQFLLFLGANLPRSMLFFLPLGVFVLLMVGFEAFLRLRVQRRLRGLVAAVFGKGELARGFGNILIGSALYAIMIGWALRWLFQGYATLPGDAVAFTVAFGVLSSVLFDRTKSIVPGALASAVFVTWILNAWFHF